MSITSIFNISLAVSLSADAASTVFELSFHKIEEQPSGEITEYIEFSSIKTVLPVPIATAPPEPPSPIITATIGTPSDKQHSVVFAIASDCPRCSAPTPG